MDQATVDKIIILYKKYGNGGKVAQELKITNYKVYQTLRLYGVEPKKNGDWQQKVDLETIKKLYESGSSLTDIAHTLNMNNSSIYERLRKAGIKLRDKLEALKLCGHFRRGSDEEILQSYKDGMNAYKIAKKYGLKDQGTILEVLKKYNVEIQTCGIYAGNWKGGKLKINKLIRNSSQYIKFNQELLAERNYTCEISGKRGGRLHIHHKIPLSQLIKDFIKEYPMIKSHEELLSLISSYAPFWDKTNLMVLSNDEHRKLHKHKF